LSVFSDSLVEIWRAFGLGNNRFLIYEEESVHQTLQRREKLIDASSQIQVKVSDLKSIELFPAFKSSIFVALFF
jgi:hypothetical protein